MQKSNVDSIDQGKSKAAPADGAGRHRSGRRAPPFVDADFLWGAAAIAAACGLSGHRGKRKTFYLLETGRLPARKIGGVWVASLAAVRRALLGDEAA